MYFLTYLCRKGIFYQELRDLGPFYFVSSQGNLGPPMANDLQNGCPSFFPSRRKIELVTTRKMISHLMDKNIIFQKYVLD